MFAFCRFIKVTNSRTLIESLSNVWIGKLRLHANVAKFDRNASSNPTHDGERVGNDPQPNMTFANGVKNLDSSKSSFASVLNAGKNSKTEVDTTPAIVLDEECILERDFSGSLMGKIKDINALSNLYVILANEGFDNVKLSYLGGLGKGCVIHVSESSCVNDNGEEIKNHGIKNELSPNSKDPFGIYELLNKHKEMQNSKGDDPTFPPGFTPKVIDDTDLENIADSVNQPNGIPISNNDVSTSAKGGSTRTLKLKTGGSIFEVMEDLVEVGRTMGYNMDGCLKDIEAIISSQGDFQETKMENIDLFSIRNLWGNFSYDFAFSPSVGYSGGLLCSSTWTSTSTKLLIVSVYAPQDLSERKSLWDYIHHMIDQWVGESVILGDFNEVRSEHERFGTIFNVSGANAFNYFISTAGLVDLSLEGYSFTWSLKSAAKMSKLDRFLVSEGLLSVFPSLSALCLDRHLSDHRPILMRDMVIDYRPTLFCVFHSWFTKDGFDKLVEDSWKNTTLIESNNITLLKKKFQALKVSIKTWCKDENQRTNASRYSIQNRISELDFLMDKGMANEDLVKERTSLTKDLQDINDHHLLDMAQKAKIR
ncbi:RNA-directed DNA polymerase, eukaryota [Tanacetum coccineum]